MTKEKVPEWLKKTRTYRLLIEAAELSFTEECQCKSCIILRKWAKIGPPKGVIMGPGGTRPGSK